MTLYEVLGVDASATHDEIRRVYVGLARRHHPDFHAAGDAVARRDTERRMQRINEAWQVLGDSDRRRAYDRELGLAARQEGAAKRSWQPVEPVGPGDDIDPRELVDDTPIGDGNRPPRALTMAPVVLAVIAVGSLGLVFVMPGRFWVTVAVLAGVLSAVLFLAASFVALAKGRRTDLSS